MTSSSPSGSSSRRRSPGPGACSSSVTSLNDSHLPRALVQNVQPLDRIAVTVLADQADPGQPDESAVPVLAKITQLLGNAAIIPLRFGSTLDAGLPAIRTWTEKLSANELL